MGVGGLAPDKYDWPGILWINWLYDREDCRGRGIGRALLDFCIECAIAQEARKLYLDTSSDKSYSRAVELYKRSGFEQEGSLHDYYEKGKDYLIFGLTLEQRSG